MGEFIEYLKTKEGWVLSYGIRNAIYGKPREHVIAIMFANVYADYKPEDRMLIEANIDMLRDVMARADAKAVLGG